MAVGESPVSGVMRYRRKRLAKFFRSRKWVFSTALLPRRRIFD